MLRRPAFLLGGKAYRGEIREDILAGSWGGSFHEQGCAVLVAGAWWVERAVGCGDRLHYGYVL